MKVEIKHQEKNVRITQMALNSAGISIDYSTTELVMKVMESIEELGEDMTLSDVDHVVNLHSEKFDNYTEEAGFTEIPIQEVEFLTYVGGHSAFFTNGKEYAVVGRDKSDLIIIDDEDSDHTLSRSYVRDYFTYKI